MVLCLNWEDKKLFFEEKKYFLRLKIFKEKKPKKINFSYF
jgi:hypothetical protein